MGWAAGKEDLKDERLPDRAVESSLTVTGDLMILCRAVDGDLGGPAETLTGVRHGVVSRGWV